MTTATLISLLGSFEPSAGRNHLIAFTGGLLCTFLGIRVNTRLIRAEKRWWFRELHPGGLHIHHMVVGVIVMVISGISIIALDPYGFWGIAAAVAFGGGVALTLDEFALLLHLEDVYWYEQGRVSVDAVIITITVALLFLGGLQPFNLDGASTLTRLGGWAVTLIITATVVLAVICFLKGKVWTGVLGCFVPVLALIGALRLAKPNSPWFRHYGPVKQERALRRDQRLAAYVRAARHAFFDLIAGKPHMPHVGGDDEAGDADRPRDAQAVPLTTPPRSATSQAGQV